MLPAKFQVNWPFIPGEAKNRFGFSMGTILAVLYLLPTKFKVNWPRDVRGVGFKAIIDAARRTTNGGRRTTETD